MLLDCLDQQRSIERVEHQVAPGLVQVLSRQGSLIIPAASQDIPDLHPRPEVVPVLPFTRPVLSDRLDQAGTVSGLDELPEMRHGGVPLVAIDPFPGKNAVEQVPVHRAVRQKSP